MELSPTEPQCRRYVSWNVHRKLNGKGLCLLAAICLRKVVSISDDALTANRLNGYPSGVDVNGRLPGEHSSDERRKGHAGGRLVKMELSPAALRCRRHVLRNVQRKLNGKRPLLHLACEKMHRYPVTSSLQMCWNEWELCRNTLYMYIHSDD
ncbi:hypothetical protein CEXT_613311 [Caerostris extrusa]|uniref:Uncharacterized protein n=1 Tax=Caerostris extrusa TaxID=172846 RepID=A0AAV4US03_CAEEX|nr:hypothetical protein CEXT_613311 [Caerostris extrusa]